MLHGSEYNRLFQLSEVRRSNSKQIKRPFLEREDWKQDQDRGQIYLQFSKTDIMGRGHYIKFRKMDFDLDPTFWMKQYEKVNCSWTQKAGEPLFTLTNNKPLTSKVLIPWLRKMGRRVGFPNADKLSGISFRRGGAQALRDQGYGLDVLGRLGRWSTPESAARYVTLTDEIVDEFASAFLRASMRNKIECGDVWV